MLAPVVADVPGGAEAAGRTAVDLLAPLNTVTTEEEVADVDTVDITINRRLAVNSNRITIRTAKRPLRDNSTAATVDDAVAI